jgi:hypothetical protein
LASVDVKEFHAMEAYLSLDLTKVKYNVKSLPTDEKETKLQHRLGTYRI